MASHVDLLSETLIPLFYHKDIVVFIMEEVIKIFNYVREIQPGLVIEADNYSHLGYRDNLKDLCKQYILYESEFEFDVFIKI